MPRHVQLRVAAALLFVVGTLLVASGILTILHAA